LSSPSSFPKSSRGSGRKHDWFGGEGNRWVLPEPPELGVFSSLVINRHPQDEELNGS
jgi:hypothetical protein